MNSTGDYRSSGQETNCQCDFETEPLLTIPHLGSPVHKEHFITTGHQVSSCSLVTKFGLAPEGSNYVVSRSPPQELEVGPLSGLYLLVFKLIEQALLVKWVHCNYDVLPHIQPQSKKFLSSPLTGFPEYHKSTCQKWLPCQNNR